MDFNSKDKETKVTQRDTKRLPAKTGKKVKLGYRCVKKNFPKTKEAKIIKHETLSLLFTFAFADDSIFKE